LKLLTQLCPDQVAVKVAAAVAHPVVLAAAEAPRAAVPEVLRAAVPEVLRAAVPEDRVAVRQVDRVEVPPVPIQILAAKFRLPIHAVEPHLPVLIREYRCIEELLAVQQQQPAQHGFLFDWVDA
jgi:hypothetical protein